MPNIKSAKKRVSVIERRKEENRYIKSTMATLIKKFREATKYDVAEAEAMLKDIISYIDSAESKGVIHKNNASRKISRLNSLLYKAKNNANMVETENKESEDKKVEEVKTEPAVDEQPKAEEVKEKAKKAKTETKPKKTAKKSAE